MPKHSVLLKEALPPALAASDPPHAAEERSDVLPEPSLPTIGSQALDLDEIGQRLPAWNSPLVCCASPGLFVLARIAVEESCPRVFLDP